MKFIWVLYVHMSVLSCRHYSTLQHLYQLLVVLQIQDRFMRNPRTVPDIDGKQSEIPQIPSDGCHSHSSDLWASPEVEVLQSRTGQRKYIHTWVRYSVTTTEIKGLKPKKVSHPTQWYVCDLYALLKWEGLHWWTTLAQEMDKVIIDTVDTGQMNLMNAFAQWQQLFRQVDCSDITAEGQVQVP